MAAALAVLALGATGCQSDDGDAQATPTTPAASSAGVATTLRHLDTKAFAEAARQQGAVLLDVRTPAEFAAGHLAGAKNLDVQATTFATQLAALDKTARYVVYCRTGHRSTVAGQQMLAAGFTKVVDLAGGITAWTAAGNPVTT